MTMKTQAVTFDIKFHADIYRDGEIFVANCPRVGVITQGNSFEEARSNIIEAVTLFVETCAERN